MAHRGGGVEPEPEPEPVSSETLSGGFFAGAKVTFYKTPKIRDVTNTESHTVLEVYDIDMTVDVSPTANVDSFGGCELGWQCWNEADDDSGETIVSEGSYASGETASLVFTSNGANVSIKGSFKANTPGWSWMQLVLTLNRSIGASVTPVKYSLSKSFYWPAPKG